MGKTVSKSGLDWPTGGRQSRLGADRGGAAPQSMKTYFAEVGRHDHEATGTEDRLPTSVFQEELGGRVRKREETQDGSTEERMQRI